MSDKAYPPGIFHLKASEPMSLDEQGPGCEMRPNLWPFHMFDSRKTASGNYIIQLVIPRSEPVPALVDIATVKQESAGINSQAWELTEYWLNCLIATAHGRENSGIEPALRAKESAWFRSFPEKSLKTKTPIAEWWEMICKRLNMEDLVKLLPPSQGDGADEPLAKAGNEAEESVPY